MLERVVPVAEDRGQARETMTLTVWAMPPASERGRPL
jgi:hypothetical protein